jgi:hypothetical protein
LNVNPAANFISNTTTMATVDSVKLSATTHPGYIHGNNTSQESADKVSQLLIENHDKFHVFFDYRELHSMPYPF